MVGGTFGHVMYTDGASKVGKATKAGGRAGTVPGVLVLGSKAKEIRKAGMEEVRRKAKPMEGGKPGGLPVGGVPGGVAGGGVRTVTGVIIVGTGGTTRGSAPAGAGILSGTVGGESTGEDPGETTHEGTYLRGLKSKS